MVEVGVLKRACRQEMSVDCRPIANALIERRSGIGTVSSEMLGLHSATEMRRWGGAGSARDSPKKLGTIVPNFADHSLSLGGHT